MITFLYLDGRMICILMYEVLPKISENLLVIT